MAPETLVRIVIGVIIFVAVAFWVAELLRMTLASKETYTRLVNKIKELGIEP